MSLTGPRLKAVAGLAPGGCRKRLPAISLPSALHCSSASCAQVAPDCHSPAVETQGLLPGGCRLGQTVMPGAPHPGPAQGEQRAR